MRQLVVVFTFLAGLGWAETGAEAWLRYARLDPRIAEQYASLPASLLTLGDSAVVKSAQTESVRGFQVMLGRTVRIENRMPAEAAIVLGTTEQVRNLDPGFKTTNALRGDAYALISANIHGQRAIVITGATDRAVL